MPGSPYTWLFINLIIPRFTFHRGGCLFRSHIDIYRFWPILFYIFTYFVWWGDFIFRRLLNWVRLLAVKWENKKTSPQNSAEHVCWSFLLCTLPVILVLWLSPLIGKGDGGYLPAGWRGGLHSQFLYHWPLLAYWTNGSCSCYASS